MNMVADQEEIHRLSLSEDFIERAWALVEIEKCFKLFPDKSIAWSDLIRLISDKDLRLEVQEYISSTKSMWMMGTSETIEKYMNPCIRKLYKNGFIGSSFNFVFNHVPNKSIALEDLRKLTYEKNSDIRKDAASALGFIFKYVPDKAAVWSDLHRLTNDEDSNVRRSSANSIGHVFKCVPDKEAVWSDLHRLSNDEDSNVRENAANAIGHVFKYVPEKAAVLSDLQRLISDENWSVRERATESFGRVFEYIPKELKFNAWNDLVRLTINEGEYHIASAYSLAYAFRYIPDKSTVFDDLHRLTNSNNPDVRRKGALVIIFSFPFIPEEHKSTAWEDLHRLTSDKEVLVQITIAGSLGYILPFVLDKHTVAVWDDLHRLVDDIDYIVTTCASRSIGRSFQFIPEDFKSDAWEDLHRLTGDTSLNVFKNPDYNYQIYPNVNSEVKKEAASAIGDAFKYIPDKHKKNAWDDLIRLTNDEEAYVRAYSNYSLGKICIYKASKSENDARSQLEKAIHHFKISIKENPWENPSNFCYPFYCSFDVVLFKKVNSNKEIGDYLSNAKEEIYGSNVKEKLVEAIEQLAGILEMAHNAKESDIGYQELLTRCSDIFNNVEQLMNENKDKTPAIHGLYEIAKPSFDKTIKELINQVKETATIAYEEARGTPAENIACLVNEEIQGWIVGSQEQMEKSLDSIVFYLKSLFINVSGHEAIISKLDDIKKHTRVEDQLVDLKDIVSLIPIMYVNQGLDGINKKIDNMNETVTRTENKVEDGFEKINQKVDLLLQTVNELKDLSSKLKEEGNEKGSQDVNDIADKIKVLLDNKDSKEISLFIEKIKEEVPSLLEEIENSTAPKDMKEKAKRGLKDTLMKFGRDISAGVATNWIAAYLPSILGAGASGLLVPGIILVALLSIESMRDKK